MEAFAFRADEFFVGECGAVNRICASWRETRYSRICANVTGEERNEGMLERLKRNRFERELDREPSKKKSRAGSAILKFGRSKGMQVVLGMTMLVLMLYAVFAFLYTTVVLYASGMRTSFLWFWPVTFFISCVAAIGLFFVVRGRLEILRIPAVLLTLLFWAMVLLLGGIFVRVYKAGRTEPKPGANYVIILGAQVRGSVPSLVLDARIRRAAEYLKENPEAIAVASGGKGTGEMISEAEAIRQGLVRLGIAEDRIILEDRSTSTLENIRFSREIIAANEQCKLLGVSYFKEALAGELAVSGASDAAVCADNSDIVVVTNDFHVYRATRLAQKNGFRNVSGCGATDIFAVTIQYYVRECIGVVLEYLRGTA